MRFLLEFCTNCYDGVLELVGNIQKWATHSNQSLWPFSWLAAKGPPLADDALEIIRALKIPWNNRGDPNDYPRFYLKEDEVGVENYWCNLRKEEERGERTHSEVESGGETVVESGVD